MDIIDNVKELKECVLFGFPFNSDEIEVLNYCTLYTNYYIYIETLKEMQNPYWVWDLSELIIKIKNDIEIEFNICEKNETLEKLEQFITPCSIWLDSLIDLFAVISIQL